MTQHDVIELFLSGDTSAFHNQFLSMINQPNPSELEVTEFVDSVIPFFNENHFPQNPDEPTGPIAEWIWYRCWLLRLVGKTKQIPEIIDEYFDSEYKRAPEWAAHVVAKQSSLEIDALEWNYSVEFEEKGDDLDEAVYELSSELSQQFQIELHVLGWAIERGAHDFSGLYSHVRLFIGEFSIIDQARDSAKNSAEESWKDIFNWITQVFIYDQVQSKSMSYAKLLGFLEFIQRDKSITNPINIANLLWCSLASNNKKVIQGAYLTFVEREAELKEKYQGSELTNCISNAALVGALLNNEACYPYEGYFLEAIERFDWQACSVYASLSSAQNAELQERCNNYLRRDPGLLPVILYSMESAFEPLEELTLQCLEPQNQFDSLRLLRNAIAFLRESV